MSRVEFSFLKKGKEKRLRATHEGRFFSVWVDDLLQPCSSVECILGLWEQILFIQFNVNPLICLNLIRKTWASCKSYFETTNILWWVSFWIQCCTCVSWCLMMHLCIHVLGGRQSQELENQTQLSSYSSQTGNTTLVSEHLSKCSEIAWPTYNGWPSPTSSKQDNMCSEHTAHSPQQTLTFFVLSEISNVCQDIEIYKIT